MAGAVNRTKYVSNEGTEIILEVPEPPMGSQSGYIPPPIITFYVNGRPVEFVYQGDE